MSSTCILSTVSHEELDLTLIDADAEEDGEENPARYRSWGEFREAFWATGQEFDMGKVVPALQALVEECSNKNCFPTSDQVSDVLAKILEDQMKLAGNRAENSSRSNSSASTIVGDRSNEEEQEIGTAMFPVIPSVSASDHASQITNWIESLGTGHGSD